MDRQIQLLEAIDEALERFGARDLVSSAEVLDFLLDLRLLAGAAPDSPEELEEILSERASSS